ncbi:MAG: MaoC family dehydratase N-terminal domain-containing protein [Actinobacteria bacterium]|nr:MaoC family dehydratase N-terminal domain-containing protein [Actinomycetota bacterium]
MALPLDKLGTRYESRTAAIDPDRAKQYAAATNDDNPAYESGKYAPPVFGVVPTWDALAVTMAELITPEMFMMLVHGEQDMHFHQPLVPGRTLVSTGEAFNIRTGSSGTRITARIESVDADSGERVMDIYNTVFVRGLTGGEDGGPDKPDHTFPEDARSREVARFTVHVDDDQTFRYRDASGDMNPIHVDDDFAKSVGLPGIINHGLCTMAMTSQAVIMTVGDGDPGRLRRLAVRFSKNVFPGNDVETVIYDAGEAGGRKAYAFEAYSAGALVIANGRAELDG